MTPETQKWLSQAGLQHDEQGRPYYIQPGGGRSYVSPASLPGGGGRPDGMEWNQDSGEWKPAQGMLEKMAPMVPLALATAGAGAALMGGAAPAAAGSETAAGVGGGLSSTAIPGGYAASLPSEAAALWGGASSGGGLGSLGDLLGAGAKGVQGMVNNAANERGDVLHAGLQANGQNIVGNANFEKALMDRAHEEAAQRKEAQRAAYRQSYASQNLSSPNNPRPGSYSPEYLATVNAQGAQAGQTLGKPAQYDLGSMPGPKPYIPIDPKDVQGATGSSPSGLERIGRVAVPGLTIADQILRLF